MKIKRSRTNKKAKIEIIPMIDVMFFLLATFIMASLAMQQINGVAVNLNHGQAENITQKNDSITITITHDNLIFINNKKTLLSAVRSSVEKIINDDNNNILIASDTDSKQGVVMQMMLEAKKAGAKKFSFVIKNQ